MIRIEDNTHMIVAYAEPTTPVAAKSNKRIRKYRAINNPTTVNTQRRERVSRAVRQHGLYYTA